MRKTDWKKSIWLLLWKISEDKNKKVTHYFISVSEVSKRDPNLDPMSLGVGHDWTWQKYVLKPLPIVQPGCLEKGKVQAQSESS